MATEKVNDARNIRDGDEHQNNEDRRIFLRFQRKAFMPSNSVTRNITIIWKSRFTDAWDTWKKVPKDERDIWFVLFKKKYRWNPTIEADVRCAFNKVGSKSISDCMSKARKRAQKPEFMNLTTWEALCRLWLEPAFIAKSKRVKTARQANKRLHTRGSISVNELKIKIREELGRESSASELFLRCHQNKNNLFVDETAKVTWEGYNEKHGAEDSLDVQSGNGAKTFPKWIDHVGSKNGTAYGVGDVDGYVQQPNMEEASAQNMPNADRVQLLDMVKVQQLEQKLMKTKLNNLKNAQEAQSKKMDEYVKAQSSSEKRLRKYVAQEVGKVVTQEVGNIVAEEMGKATQQLLDGLRILPRLKDQTWSGNYIEL